MEFTIRRGTIQDTENLIHLLQEVRQGMERKDWLYLDDPADVRKAMKAGTMQLWVAEGGKRLAGIFDILVPGLEEYNYGYALGLSREELLRVIHMDTAAVHPDYRGHGLQRALMLEAEKYAAGKGKCILLTTVHPENRFSLNNMLRLGYTIEKQVALYGSSRFILRKDLPEKD